MSQADAANTTTRARAASNIISPALQGFTVSIADGPNGSYRPLQDRFGEPEIFDTSEQAVNAALAWGRALGVASSVDPIGEPTPEEMDALISDLDAAAARPTLEDCELWSVIHEAQVAVARYRRMAMQMAAELAVETVQ